MVPSPTGYSAQAGALPAPLDPHAAAGALASRQPDADSAGRPVTTVLVTAYLLSYVVVSRSRIQRSSDDEEEPGVERLHPKGVVTADRGWRRGD